MAGVSGSGHGGDLEPAGADHVSVRHRGQVEVEYYNADNGLDMPTDYHQTQVVKADDAGIFTMSCPRAGWWGFAALTEGDFTVKDPDGKDKPVEMGAVLWTKFDDWKKR